MRNTKKGSSRKQLTSAGFFLAILGSALGLGNIWKFPYIMGSNGGGSFIIPYLIALVIIAIPMFAIETAIGKKYLSGNVFAWKKINPKASIFGWFQIAILIVLASYYAVVIGWSIISLVQAFIPSGPHAWNTNFNFVNHGNVNPGNITNLSAFGSPNIIWIFALLITWLILVLIVKSGIVKGVEFANKIMLPILFIIVIALTIYCLTLSGASNGLNFVFTPTWLSLGKVNTWTMAVGQAFFSSSLATGAIIAFARYAPQKQDINNTAITVLITNTLVAVFFSVIVYVFIAHKAYLSGYTTGDGFMAYYNSHSGELQGPPLIFNVFPQLFALIHENIGYIANIFGVIFFIGVLFAAITSIVSMVFVLADNIRDRFLFFKRRKQIWSTLLFAIPCFLLGVLFTCKAGVFILDATDHWLTFYIYLLSGLGEVLILGWGIKRVHEFTKYGTTRSAYSISLLAKISFYIISPIAILLLLFLGLYHDVGFSLFASNHNRFLAIAIAIPCVFVLLLLKILFQIYHQKIAPIALTIGQIIITFLLVAGCIFMLCAILNITFIYGNYPNFLNVFGMIVSVSIAFGFPYVMHRLEVHNLSIRLSKGSA